MRGKNDTGVSLRDDLAEDAVAQVAGGFFDGLPALLGVGLGVDPIKLQRNFQPGTEVRDEDLVRVGFRAPQRVVDVHGGEADAESVARESVGRVDEEQKSSRIGPTGDGEGDAVAGTDGNGWKGEVHFTINSA